MLLPLVAYMVFSVFSLSCQSLEKTSAVANDSHIVATVQPKVSEQDEAFKYSVALVRAENLSFKEEFTSFKTALAEYKKSQEYKNPQSIREQTLQELVNAADLLTEEAVLKLIKEKRFSKIEEQAQKNLSYYEKRVKELFAPVTVAERSSLKLLGEEVLPAEDEDELAPEDEDELAPEDEDKKPSASVFNTGVAFASMGSLGLLSVSYKAALGFNFVTSVSAGALALGLFLALPTAADETKLKTARGVLMAGSVLSGLVALGFTAFAWQQGLEDARLAKGWHQPGTSDIKQASDKMMGSLYVTALSGLISTGLAVWARSLHLSDSLTPQDLVMAKIGRAFIAFEKLEKSRGAA